MEQMGELLSFMVFEASAKEVVSTVLPIAERANPVLQGSIARIFEAGPELTLVVFEGFAQGDLETHAEYFGLARSVIVEAGAKALRRRAWMVYFLRSGLESLTWVEAFEEDGTQRWIAETAPGLPEFDAVLKSGGFAPFDQPESSEQREEQRELFIWTALRIPLMQLEEDVGVALVERVWDLPVPFVIPFHFRMRELEIGAPSRQRARSKRVTPPPPMLLN